MLRFGYDVPHGQIIGSFYSTGQLYYDGRPQGGSFDADTEHEVMKQARDRIAEYKADFSGYPHYLYSDDTKWQVKIS